MEETGPSDSTVASPPAGELDLNLAERGHEALRASQRQKERYNRSCVVLK